MRLNIILFCLLTVCFTISESKAQCDTIKVYDGDFDNVFQFIYQTIDADSILAVRHCYTTNGCARTFGLLYWVKNNKTNFKLIKREGGKTKESQKLKENLKAHLDEFYKMNLFQKTEKVETTKNLFIDDGPVTIAVFKTKSECWRFGYTLVQVNQDIRVIWINKLLTLMK